MLKLEAVALKLGHTEFCFELLVKVGESLAILGPSGAGKSTLLNLIGGFLQPDSGKILYQGLDISKKIPADRPIDTLFQSHNLFAHLTAAQNIGLGINPGLKLNTQDTAKIQSVLSKTGLQGYEHRKPSQLSGGQAQRVALARCLIRNKPVLLLDEPFSALDEETRLEMLMLTKQVTQSRQTCTIFVTHNEEDAKKLCKRIIRVSDGRIQHPQG